MKKKLYFGSNLKMYKNVQDTVAYLKKLSDNTADLSRDEIQLFIIPSFTSLDRATASIDQNSILLGAQNMCWEDQGQFTGEISPLMLKELGIKLVMIGHSERRHVFGETDYEENKKVKSFSKPRIPDTSLHWRNGRTKRIRCQRRNSAHTAKDRIPRSIQRSDRKDLGSL